jgi:ubiquitin C-terminal hydrolase
MNTTDNLDKVIPIRWRHPEHAHRVISNQSLLSVYTKWYPGAVINLGNNAGQFRGMKVRITRPVFDARVLEMQRNLMEYEHPNADAQRLRRNFRAGLRAIKYMEAMHQDAAEATTSVYHEWKVDPSKQFDLLNSSRTNTTLQNVVWTIHRGECYLYCVRPDLDKSPLFYGAWSDEPRRKCVIISWQYPFTVRDIPWDVLMNLVKVLQGLTKWMICFVVEASYDNDDIQVSVIDSETYLEFKVIDHTNGIYADECIKRQIPKLSSWTESGVAFHGILNHVSANLDGRDPDQVWQILRKIWPTLPNEWHGAHVPNLISTTTNIVHHRNPDQIVVGTHVPLPNIGLSCYINAMVQLLYAIENFKTTIMGGAWQDPILIALQAVFTSMATALDVGTMDRTRVEKLLSELRDVCGFPERSQQDTYEFMNKVLNQIPRNARDSHFGVYWRRERTCLNCFERYDILELNDSHMIIQFSSGTEIASMDELSRLIEPEEEVDFKCACNGKLRRAKRKAILLGTADSLIITLARFSYAGSSASKIHIPVDVTESVILDRDDCQKETYDLQSVIFHCGQELVSGHYYVFVKDETGRIQCNDDQIRSAVTFAEMMQARMSESYILEYRKRKT